MIELLSCILLYSMKILYPYQKIAEELRIELTCGKYNGKKLPSERKFMETFRVQRDTIRRALKMLEDEGLLNRDSTGARLPTTNIPLQSRTTQGNLALIMRPWDKMSGPLDILRGLTGSSNLGRRSVIWLEQDYTSILDNVSVRPEELQSQGIDAAVIWPQLPLNLDYIRTLRRLMPITVLDRRIPGFECDYIGFDDLAGGRTITEHLISLGHRHIGFIGAEPYVSTTQMRALGYKLALESAGMESNRVYYGDNVHSVPNDAMLEAILTKNGEPLTAIICANDSIAAKLIVSLRNMGRRVPEDVAVTGFGNMLSPFLDALELTTMAQPFERMGFLAGEYANKRLNNPICETQEIELPLELIIRGSCGARK